MHIRWTVDTDHYSKKSYGVRDSDSNIFSITTAYPNSWEYREELKSDALMDANKIISVFEELAVEVAIWLILVPLTLFRVLTNPQEVVSNYDLRQVESMPGQNKYLEPVRFWLLVGPLFFLVWAWIARHDTSIAFTFGNDFNSMASISTLTFLIGPLGFAWQDCTERKLPLVRENLEHAFRRQCYPFGASTFIFISIMSLTEVISSEYEDFLFIPTMGLFLWNFFSQIKIAQLDDCIVHPLGHVFQGIFKVSLLFSLWLAVSFVMYLNGSFD